MRLDALPRLHTATGPTSMAWPCRVWLPSSKARSAQPRCVSTERSQCTESVTAASGVETSRALSSRPWVGIQIPAGRRCAREYEFVWQDCLPPRTIRVGARGRGKSWSQRLPPRHTRARPSLSRTRRVGSASRAAGCSVALETTWHPNWHRDTHPRIDEFRVADGALEPRRRVGHGNNGPSMAVWSRGSHLRPRSPVCLFQHVARCIVATAAAMAISALGCCCAALQSRQPPPAPLHLCISAHWPFSLASALGPTPVLCALRLAPRASCLAVTPNCVTRLPSAKLQPPQPSPPVGIAIHHPKPPIALLGKLPAAALLPPSRSPACSNSAAVRNAPVRNRNCNRTRAQPFIRLQPPYLTTLQAPLAVFPRVT
jgi:hypothetical protein